MQARGFSRPIIFTFQSDRALSPSVSPPHRQAPMRLREIFWVSKSLRPPTASRSLSTGALTISGTIGAYMSFPFNFSQTFRAGDTVDFVNVGPAAVSLGYMTALTATITPVAVPAISPNGVVSAGGFGAFSAIAPGTWIEIYGSNLATNTRSWAGSDFVGTTSPTKLDGTSVAIGGQAAFVDYISPGQVNALVPSNVGTGTQQLTVTAPTGISSPFTVTVNSTEPGLLAPSSFSINGTQYVVALFTDGTYVLPVGAIAGINSRPAKPGDVIVLYGIGFGPVTPNIPAGQVVGQSNTVSSGLQISIGGQMASLPYDGLAFNYTGLYQFNVTVPQVSPGTLPLTFSLGGVPGTQTLNIAIGQ